MSPLHHFKVNHHEGITVYHKSHAVRQFALTEGSALHTCNGKYQTVNITAERSYKFYSRSKELKNICGLK